jgi:hypothetical protein
MACSKIPYPTIGAARFALSRISGAGEARRECAIYPCREHHAFHLTSDRRAVRNKWMNGHTPSRPDSGDTTN